MDFLKKRKIKDQILLAMIIGTLLSCTILGVTIYNISKVTIENNYKNSHTYNLQVSSNIIDIQLKNIIELGRSVLTDDSFKKALTSEDNNKNGRYFSSINSLTLNRSISEIVSHDPLIDGISIVNEYGNVLFYSKRSIPSGYYRYYYSKDNFLEEDWVEKAREAKGKEVFYGYNVLIPDQEGDTISYVKNYSHKAKTLIQSIQNECWDKRDQFFYSVDVDIKTIMNSGFINWNILALNMADELEGKNPMRLMDVF